MTQQYPPQQPPGGGFGGQPPQQPPYGQQPPPQQPYGQPPRPPQPYGQPVGGPGTPPGGMPPQTPGGGMPATPSYPPTPKKSKTRIIVIGVVVLVALGVIGYFTYQNSKTSASAAGAGDCIKVNSQTDSDADVEKIDCNSAEAVYKVGKKLDGVTGDCPSEFYDKYTQTGGKGNDFALCLMLNAKQGECFSNVTSTSNGKTAKVDCAAADAEGKVTKVVAGQAADSACPKGTGLALAYPEPAPGETVCMVQAHDQQGA